MRNLIDIRMLAFLFCLLCLPGIVFAASATVAVFPLQELGEARNGVNLPLTRLLNEQLQESGNEIIGLETVISFMSNNRIRNVGYLEPLFISRARRDLGAAFVLLGTVSQRKERPEPSLGLTLNLVRTSDVRSVWSYVGSVSTGEERRILTLGEPETTADLQPILMEELVAQWPWGIINDEQLVAALKIDSSRLSPQYVRPGDEISCRVKLLNTWPPGQAPRVFFKADDQIYPATPESDEVTFEGRWVAGEENGRFPVSLVLEWPHYGRTESTLLGNYLIDGTPPLFELEFQGAKILDGRPVFDRQLVILPRMIVRKPLARWRLSFYYEDDTGVLGDMKGSGNLPRSFGWSGMAGVGDRGDGLYRIKVEVWDKAGNIASVTEEVEMLRSVPNVDFALARAEKDVVVNLGYDGKVPLSYWRLEMWTREGEIVAQNEGKDLPVKIDVDVPDSEQGQVLEGFLSYRDILGKQVRKKISDLLPSLAEKPKEKKKQGVSEEWVDQF